MRTMSRSRSAVVTLPSEKEILITRDFDAPPEAVYRAYTTPELVQRWWNAKRGEVTVAEIDLHVGGSWRFAMETPDGTEVAFHGVYREIVPNERIVATEFYEGFPDGEALSTITFAPRAGGSTLTILVAHNRREHRDAHIESGMEDGLQDALDLLEEAAAGE